MLITIFHLFMVVRNFIFTAFLREICLLTSPRNPSFTSDKHNSVLFRNPGKTKLLSSINIYEYLFLVTTIIFVFTTLMYRPSVSLVSLISYISAATSSSFTAIKTESSSSSYRKSEILPSLIVTLLLQYSRTCLIIYSP